MDKTTEFISHDMIKYKFEIQNFKFDYKNRQKLNIHSDPIIIGCNNRKTTWRLGIETSEEDPCSAGSRMTVNIQLESFNNSEITTQFSMGLLSKSNRTRQLGNYDIPRTFKSHETIGHTIAPHTFCNNYVKDGTVTIFLSIKTDGSVSLIRANSAKIYETRPLADCCFIIGENRIMAHRIILAENSPFFYKLFSNDPNLNEFDLTAENVDVASLQKVLYFMYHGYTSNDWMNTDVLLMISLKFGLPYLTKMCVSVLCSALTAENAVDTLKLAFAHDLPSLKHGVMMFLDKHILAVSKTQAWLDLLENNFEMIKDWIISLSLVKPKPSIVHLSSNYTEQGYRPRNASKLMNENERKFLQELSTDVLLKVDDSSVIKAEKAILSEKSSVFQAMFSYQMSENKENIVNITDVEFDTLRELVRFMYCKKIFGLDTLAISLIAAADKYNMTDLKSICEDYLHSIMNLENLVDFLQASEFYVAQKLKRECILFVGQHLQHFLNNKEFLDVVKNNPPKFLNQMIMIWADGLNNN